MSRRPQLSREVPATSVSKFNEWCESEGHLSSGDKGRRAEQAIVEYLPPTYRPERFRNELDALESDLRADLNEVADLDDDSSLKASTGLRSGDETVKLTYRIAEDVQDALERYVYDQEDKVRGVTGEYVAAALDEHRDGGLSARVRRLYEQLCDSVDMVPEDRVKSVVQRLREEAGDRDMYHIEDVRTAVEKALDVHSNEVRNDFAERAITRLGFVAVETGNGVFATPERAKEIVQEHETDSDPDWHSMDREDRVEYLKEAVKARSQQTGKGAGVDYKQVGEDIFDDRHSDDHCYKLMNIAGEDSGFTYEEHNGKLMLRYTAGGDPSVLNSNDDWIDEAVDILERFCEKNEEDPSDLPQPLIDNGIIQAKYPEEYDNVCGPSDQALEAITEDARTRVLNHLRDSLDSKQKQDCNEIKTKFEQIQEAEPVADGGRSEL